MQTNKFRNIISDLDHIRLKCEFLMELFSENKFHQDEMELFLKQLQTIITLMRSMKEGE